MARVHLDGVAHSYGPDRRAAAADYALRPMDLVWQDGGAYALLGPSGCGKTTLLNVISGLITPSRGRVLFDGTDVTDVPTERRNIAQVFQFPVLYDTMTVFDNLAFPLRNRGLKEPDVRARVHEVAGMLELTGSLGRRAAGLGADDKQKISLGRGLVRSDVAAILFDEPLTVIDPLVKFQLRRKLKEIHERFRITLVYVTHDQNEALTFADQVVVMVDGRVVQIGTPEALFERPEHTFVGYFIGSPGMNILPAAGVEGGTVRIDGGAAVPLPGPLLERAAAAGRRGGALKLGIRPQYVGIAAEGRGADGPKAEVAGVEELGTHRIVDLVLGVHRLKARLEEGDPVPSGKVRLDFPPERTLLYEDDRLIAV